MRPADAVVDAMLDPLVAELGLGGGQPVALLVNGLGATPAMELSIVTRRCLSSLGARGIKVERVWTGNFMTALEMPGCSISLLPLDARRIGLLDAPSQAPAWPGGGRVGPAKRVAAPLIDTQGQLDAVPGALSPLLRKAVSRIAEALEAAEPRLTALDSHAGDGDLGASMTRGAEALRSLAEASYASPERLLADIAAALRRAIAGSSGPLYASALLRAAHHLTGNAAPGEADWLEAFDGAIAALRQIGGAAAGDRTMLDALIPAAEAWRRDGWVAVPDAARASAEATSSMRPRMGRAAYLGERAMGQPDGGAVAVAIWLAAIAEAVRT
jgi:dihydroxyacetone kinase